MTTAIGVVSSTRNRTLPSLEGGTRIELDPPSLSFRPSGLGSSGAGKEGVRCQMRSGGEDRMGAMRQKSTIRIILSITQISRDH